MFACIAVYVEFILNIPGIEHVCSEHTSNRIGKGKGNGVP